MVVAAIVLAVVAGAGFFLLSPLEADPDVDAALAQGNMCIEGCGWTFGPRDADIGIVFYAGARVEPEAYAPMAALLGEAGYLVIVPRFPLNFAVFDSDRAATEIAAHPEVDHWVMAGHSLGGVMATRFADSDERIDGLILLGAFPEASIDLRSADLDVLLITASEDGLIDPSQIQESLSQFPADTIVVDIDGGNHAQFGWYGSQPGDGEATISREQQLLQVSGAIRSFLYERFAGRRAAA